MKESEKKHDKKNTSVCHVRMTGLVQMTSAPMLVIKRKGVIGHINVTEASHLFK